MHAAEIHSRGKQVVSNENVNLPAREDMEIYDQQHGRDAASFRSRSTADFLAMREIYINSSRVGIPSEMFRGREI